MATWLLSLLSLHRSTDLMLHKAQEAAGPRGKSLKCGVRRLDFESWLLSLGLNFLKYEMGDQIALNDLKRYPCIL